ncbi:glycosyltransferase family 2 protein [Rhodoferax sp.]|uniref:glycosyltransferase family 2 protein n=1 Tax=Rhodoferax sp. TaxID=50421 RepID=UPI00374D99B3
MNAKVSVCIPTYRGAAFLGKTIESVLNQTYPYFELCILDDHSPDDTPKLLARYGDPRIKYIRNTHNLGPEGNWNRCLEVAHGKYFKLLPHDDLLAPDCLEKQVAVLENDPAGQIALVFGSRNIIDTEGRVLMRRGLARQATGRIESGALVKRCIRAGSNLIGEPGNGLVRHEIIKKVGTYDASHPYLVDLDYWFRVLAHGDAYYTATQTSAFRVSPGSWSVAIGGKQHRDFKGFVDKFKADTRFCISGADRTIGLAKAHLNTIVRAAVYHAIFAKNQ